GVARHRRLDRGVTTNTVRLATRWRPYVARTENDPAKNAGPLRVVALSAARSAPATGNPVPPHRGLLPVSGLELGARAWPLAVAAALPHVIAAVPGPVSRHPYDALGGRWQRRHCLDTWWRRR